MPPNTVIKAIAWFVIFSVASLARAEDDSSSTFITIKLVRCWEDGAGNAWDDIVVSNTHESRAIRASVGWISVARERGVNVNLAPGQQRVIAKNQSNAREVHVVEAHFK
jgi:hypothetical protein